MNGNKNISFTWDIHYKCNFRCPYCWFYNNWSTMELQNIYLSPQEWMRHWEKIYNKYGSVHIEITGGEPFIYPNFVGLIKLLSTIHTLKITTNLSGDIEAFTKEIEPQRVSLDMNFHILFSHLEEYIKKVLILKKAGFKGDVCYLAYPPQMQKIDYLSKRFQEAGIGFALAAYWGKYNEMNYPESYNYEEREMMKPFLGDVARINYHLNAQSPKGKLCNAGYRYAGIHANGDVVRCGPLAEKVIGNILNDNFSLFDKPLPCEAEVCPCNEYTNLVSKID